MSEKCSFSAVPRGKAVEGSACRRLLVSVQRLLVQTSLSDIKDAPLLRGRERDQILYDNSIFGVIIQTSGEYSEEEGSVRTSPSVSIIFPYLSYLRGRRRRQRLFVRI
jgi:hypothetical protein